jgi:hypothetical protein
VRYLIAITALLVSSISIPGAAVANAAAVTVSGPGPHLVVAVRHSDYRNHWYKVHPGDTLSSIAKDELGHTGKWPALWFVNRREVKNPNKIRKGEILRLPSRPRKGQWVTELAVDHSQAPAPPPRAASTSVVSASSAPAPAPVPQAAPAPPAAAPVVASGASGGYQACVIQAESNGNPGAVNPVTGAGGLYGFLPSTWAALGYSGAPQDASVATQNAAFAKEYARAGTSAWSPYDGC